MRIYFHILILVASFMGGGQCHLSAQQSGFTKTYFIDNRSTIFHAIRPYGDNLIVLGQLGGDSLGLNGIFVAEIDTFGEIKKLRIFQDSLHLNNLNISYYSCEAICPTIDGGFIFAATTRAGKNLVMIKVDQKMEIEFYKEYECDFLFRFVNFIITYLDASYAIGIVQTKNLDFDIFIQKTDLNGNQIWEKTYGNSQNWENAQSAIIEMDGISILRSDVFDPDQFQYNDDFLWNKVMHIDTSGEVLWNWISGLNEEGSRAEGLLKVNQNYFYTTHPGYQPSSQTIHYAPEIVCRDSLFNLKWRRTYGDTLYYNWFSTLTTGPDSFIYAGGYIPDVVTWGRVCKIDPENGDLIWDARDTAFYIPGWGSRNRLEGLTVLPSGSVIAVGYTVDYTNHENGLLYKVTKDGCIDTLCTIVDIEDLIANQPDKVKVYPNPTTQEITIDIGDHQNCSVDFYDLQGRKVYHQQLHEKENKLILDRNLFLTGVYIWRVTTKDGSQVQSGKIVVVR